jgi:hypothetical protein
MPNANMPNITVPNLGKMSVPKRHYTEVKNLEMPKYRCYKVLNREIGHVIKCRMSYFIVIGPD